MTSDALLTPCRHRAEDQALDEVLALIRRCFAGMEGRIDPPSSMHRLDPGALRHQCQIGEIWSLGSPVVACVFLTPQADALYVGKLAVDNTLRRAGLARRLMALAETRARALALSRLRLQTRVELIENHATFAALGLRETARTCHPGFSRPTSIVFEKDLGPQASQKEK